MIVYHKFSKILIPSRHEIRFIRVSCLFRLDKVIYWAINMLSFTRWNREES